MDDKVKFGYLGLIDETFHYSPVLSVEDRFWKLKPEVRLKILEGWAEALEVLMDGNDVFGGDDEDSEKPEELSSAVIINFPTDNV
tara:strand:+ start:450 stop:704 length:255 start_codon:yes stop_codon:yes gene_type:complete